MIRARKMRRARMMMMMMYLVDLMQSDAVRNWNLGKTSVYKIDNDTNSIPTTTIPTSVLGGGLRDLISVLSTNASFKVKKEDH
jgi:hypothetical protein